MDPRLQKIVDRYGLTSRDVAVLASVPHETARKWMPDDPAGLCEPAPADRMALIESRVKRGMAKPTSYATASGGR